MPIITFAIFWSRLANLKFVLQFPPSTLPLANPSTHGVHCQSHDWGAHSVQGICLAAISVLRPVCWLVLHSPPLVFVGPAPLCPGQVLLQAPVIFPPLNSVQSILNTPFTSRIPWPRTVLIFASATTGLPPRCLRSLGLWSSIQCCHVNTTPHWRSPSGEEFLTYLYTVSMTAPLLFPFLAVAFFGASLHVCDRFLAFGCDPFACWVCPLSLSASTSPLGRLIYRSRAFRHSINTFSYAFTSTSSSLPSVATCIAQLLQSCSVSPLRPHWPPRHFVQSTLRWYVPRLSAPGTAGFICSWS
ncbi:hypothetical protein DFH27DRAFT_218205 [Peziza echinospora]|nr:hypothetical protein DFH27DRAFT_218205 [Peziza echinospora]